MFFKNQVYLCNMYVYYIGTMPQLVTERKAVFLDNSPYIKFGPQKHEKSDYILSG